MFSSVGRLLPGAYRPLFAVRPFRRLLPVFALSDLGDGMSTVAVAWLALSLAPHGGQGTLVAVSVAAYTLPGALGALVLGRWLRRLSAQRLLVADAVLRALLLGAIPVARLTGTLGPAGYVVLLGASSLLHAWGKAGKYALFAPLLDDGVRLAANTVLSTSLSVATVLGPVLAGLLAGTASPAWIIGLDAVTFVVLAIQASRIVLPAAPAGSPGAGSARQGLGVLRRHPELLGLLVLTWLFNLAYGPVEVALPLFVVRSLSAGAGLLGAYWAAFGAGAVVGALGAGAARRLPLWPTMFAIVAGHGIALLPFTAAHTAVPSLIGFALAGVVYGPYSALSLSLLQDRAPSGSLTTVLAARSAVLITASPLGATLGGLLLNRVAAPVLLGGCGIAMILTAALAAALHGCHALRRRQRAVTPAVPTPGAGPSHDAASGAQATSASAWRGASSSTGA
ncbi:MFS transporter [Kitasatospora sp. RB6PN24]|uniref:MFS transporter n=1 Tax=Kitasatospora humi TaxID=2893891 RepID=UPI001E41063D|nr:MFS transporter [Kitasatospora humi]MCC9306199.1 MFS transporter [Kitasatospora humi]